MSNEVEPFELFAVRYATHHRNRKDNFIGGDPHDAPMPLDYYLWIARNSRGTYIVDTGFDGETAKKRSRTLLIEPSEALVKMGVKADEIKDVLVTHLHYDHIGNFGLFPNAGFHIQETEMSFATGPCMCHPRLRHPYEVEHIVGIVRSLYEGRVKFHQGDSEVAPGLSVHLIGGHTLGLQAVRVWTRRGWVVLASDASHHYDHVGTGRPFPNLVRMDQMLDGFNRLKELADSDQHIIPGHDPLVMKHYPAVSSDLEGIAVRLDVPPLEPTP